MRPSGHTGPVTPAALDDNDSCWLDELPAWQPTAALAADLVADVAIVGGGITGVSSAWHFARAFPCARIVLLEAKTLANGATGRSGGQVLNGVNGVEPADPETARRVHAATSSGIAIVGELASHSTLPAGFVREGAMEATTTAAAAEAARSRVQRAASWGIPLRWIDGGATGLAGVQGAVLDPGGARVNPAALVRGLRAPLEALGVGVYEHTPVTAIREGRPIEIDTPGGRVRAAAMVLATNAYTPSLGWFRGRILPLHSRVVATAPLAPSTWSGLGQAARNGFADDLDRIAYGVRTPGDRLLFGGGSNAAYVYRLGGSPVPGREPASAYAAVERTLQRYFPGIGIAASVEKRWSGPLAVTFDRVCSMGVTGAHRNVYYALGYSGHGLALGALAGRVLADLHAGNADDWRGLPFFQRTMPWIPPDPFRWIGYQLYTKATGRSPRRH